MNRNKWQFWKTRWSAFLRVLVGCVFVFSTSAFAQANTQPMDMMSDIHIPSQSLQDVENYTLHGADMINHDGGCDPEGDILCMGDNDCMTPCPTASFSLALLSSPYALEHLGKVSIRLSYNLSNDGITPRLNAPPPRT